MILRGQRHGSIFFLTAYSHLKEEMQMVLGDIAGTSLCTKRYLSNKTAKLRLT